MAQQKSIIKNDAPKYKTLGLSYWLDGVTDPKTPVGKIKLADLMNYDDRPSYKHKKLWDFHLQWAHSGYDHTSLASLRVTREVMLSRSPTGKAMSLQHINTGNTDLCGWGYLKLLEKGRGTRASRFDVNWGLLALAAAGKFPPSVTLAGDTSDAELSVTYVGDTGVTLEVTLEDDSVTYVGDKDPTIGNRLEEPGTEIVGFECAAPSAPLAPAAEAAGAAGTAQRGFMGLWRTYDYPKGIKAAKAAYSALAPDNELHARLLVAAEAWRSAWAAQHKPDAPRKHLATWLNDEEFECDPPSGYVKKEKAKSPEAGTKSTGLFPDGYHRFRIDAATEIGSAFNDEWAIEITLVGDEGEVDGITYNTRLDILCRHADGVVAGADQDAVDELRQLTGRDCPVSFLPGKFIGAHNSDDGRISFTPDPAGMRLVEIDTAELVTEGDEQWIRISLTEPWAGDDSVSQVPTGRLDIIHKSRRPSQQTEGEEQLRKMISAIGLKHLTHTENLEFCRFTLTGDGGFLPAPGNDDQPERQAA